MVSGLIMLGGDRHAPVAGDAARRHADRAPHRRVRGDRRPGRRRRSASLADLHRARSRSGPNRSRGAADRPAAAIRFSPASSPMPSASPRGASTTSRSPAAANRCRRSSAARCRSASTAWPSSRRRSRPARVRALAISSAERLPGLDAPTLREQGVDVEFENWRSRGGAAGHQRRRSAAPRRRRSRRWCSPRRGATRSTRYRWIDRYLGGRRVRALRRQRGGARAARSCSKLGTGARRRHARLGRPVSGAGARRPG